MAVYAMFGVLMLTSKIVMEAVPNVHLLGMFTMLLTVVYRRRALYPIYVYVLLNGVYAGFASWWLPYLYIWTVLWGVTMLLPRNMPKKCAARLPLQATTLKSSTVVKPASVSIAFASAPLTTKRLLKKFDRPWPTTVFRVPSCINPTKFS